MRNLLLVVLGIAIGAIGSYLVLCSGSDPEAASSPAGAEELQSIPDTVSYAIGFSLSLEVAAGLAFDEVEVRAGDMVKGFSDGMTGQTPAVDGDKMQDALYKLHDEVVVRSSRKLQEVNVGYAELCKANAAVSKTYLEEHRAKPGVEVLDNGIQYEVVDSGAGESPGPRDIVVVSFKAELIDGTVSAEQESVEFYIPDMLPAVGQLMMQMKTGDHWIVTVPPAQGFGAAGKPPHIGPNEVVIVDVTLEGIKSPEEVSR